MDILIFGAGSLGSLLGGLLSRTHEVTLVGREPHVGEVRRDGLRITGVETVDVHPAATTDGTEVSADLAVVTVKASDTEEAARTLATGDVDAVCSLQNGMGNEDVLAAHLDGTVLAGTATYGARLAGPGHVEWLGRGRLTVGPWRPEDDVETAERVVAAFRAADLDATVTTDARGRLWEKLAVNAAINPVTALARVENGALAPPGELADLATAAGVETAGVARADGASLSDATVRESIAEVVHETERNRSSMLQDVTDSRRTEIDAINGYVVDRAEELEESVPVNRTLATLIRGWEAGAGVE
ncbi:ketopantoate reductase family protein [Haloplanus litoreus]|uniref:2-dehydropantoate 2-reductase n=1 Tax=Haloplanus litoreus TaxID=767515 RepID=A0ABD6A1Y1_9EURY